MPLAAVTHVASKGGNMQGMEDCAPPGQNQQASRQQDRANRAVREVPEDAARPRFTSVARRTGPANFRKRLRAGMEAVGRPTENDSERIPSNAVAEGSAGTDRTSDGGLLFRGRRRVATRVRATANEITPHSRHSVQNRSAVGHGSKSHLALDDEVQHGVGLAKCALDGIGGLACCKNKSQIASALG